MRTDRQGGESAGGEGLFPAREGPQVESLCGRKNTVFWRNSRTKWGAFLRRRQKKGGETGQSGRVCPFFDTPSRFVELSSEGGAERQMKNEESRFAHSSLRAKRDSSFFIAKRSLRVYPISMWRETFTSSFLTFGSTMVSTPFSTLAEMPFLSTSSGRV